MSDKTVPLIILGVCAAAFVVVIVASFQRRRLGDLMILIAGVLVCGAALWGVLS